MCWIYDRPARLEALVARALRRAEILRREMFDAPRGSAARDRLAGRLDLVERRVRRLRDVARWARRAARDLVA